MSAHSLFRDNAVPANSPGRRTVGQVMRPPTTIEPEAHLAAAAYLIEHSHDSALVVMPDDTHEPVAMITDAEITGAVAQGRNLENTRIGQFVTAKPVTVQAEVLAEDAARLMLSQGVQHLPVVEGRRLVGMVELADLCRDPRARTVLGRGPEHRDRGPNEGRRSEMGRWRERSLPGRAALNSDSEDLRPRGEMRTREQALQVLSRVGIRDAEADRLLSGIEFPATLSQILAHLGEHGITLDSLTDTMGGSP